MRSIYIHIDEEAGQDGQLYPVIKWVNKLFTRGPAHVYGADEVSDLDARLAAVNAERKRKRAQAESEPDPFGNG